MAHPCPKNKWILTLVYFSFMMFCFASSTSTTKEVNNKYIAAKDSSSASFKMYEFPWQKCKDVAVAFVTEEVVSNSSASKSLIRSNAANKNKFKIRYDFLSVWLTSTVVTYSSSTPFDTAIEFSGDPGNDGYVVAATNSALSSPLRRQNNGHDSNSGTSSIPASKTSSDPAAQPWAIASVFMHKTSVTEIGIWSQTQGIASEDGKVSLSVLNNQLLFYFGKDANHLIWTATDALVENTWYAVYIDYNGGSTGSGSGDVPKYYSRFRIRLVDLGSGVVTEPSGVWNHSNYGFEQSIRGEFYVGSEYEVASRSNMQMASVTLTTLMQNSDLPTDAEITLFTLDPLQWLIDEKLGKSWRVPNNSTTLDNSNFQINDTDQTTGAYGTKVWLMGDGVGDAGGAVKNQVSRAVSAQDLNTVNMVANPFVNIGEPLIIFTDIVRCQAQGDLTLEATSSSGGTISYQIVGNAHGTTLIGDIVTLGDPGIVEIKATVAADAGYVESSKTIKLRVLEGGLYYDGVDDSLELRENSTENSILYIDPPSNSGVIAAGETSDVGDEGDPFALMVTFSLDKVTGRNTLLYQRNGSVNTKPRFSVRVDNKNIYLRYGSNNGGTSNVGYANIFESSSKIIEAGKWYGLYLDYNGGSMSTGNIAQRNSRIRIKLVDLITGDTSDVLGTWSVTANGGIDQSIDNGALYLGDYNEKIKGYIGAHVQTTLRGSLNLPDADEIALMTIDPREWLVEHKLGKEWRKPNASGDTTNFSMDPNDAEKGAKGTKVWILDCKDTYVRNEVSLNEEKDYLDFTGLSCGPSTSSVAFSNITRTKGDSDFDLTGAATATSGGSITYSVQGAPNGTSIAGSIVSLGNAGTVTIEPLLRTPMDILAHLKRRRLLF